MVIAITINLDTDSLCLLIEKDSNYKALESGKSWGLWDYCSFPCLWDGWGGRGGVERKHRTEVLLAREGTSLPVGEGGGPCSVAEDSWVLGSSAQAQIADSALSQSSEEVEPHPTPAQWDQLEHLQ